MKKAYDFVFVYEVKNRELENDCLIACELEKRGYSVGFVETWAQQFWHRKALPAKVAVGFAMYNENVLHFIASYVTDCSKFVNMQWEQVISNGARERSDDREDSSIGIVGKAQNARHIAWGENTVSALTKKYGVPKEHIRVTGHVSLDFFRDNLRRYFLPREEILKKYNIKKEKKIVLFISSFATVGAPAIVKNDKLYQSMFVEKVDAYEDISVKSQRTVLDWFVRYLAKNKDKAVVYRPHPAEAKNPYIYEIAKRHERFYVIDDYSIKQWILISDFILTWVSTSIAEIYSSGKNCGILRPYEIPYEFDIEIYNGAKMIQDFEGMESLLNSSDMDRSFPIDEAVFSRYYSIESKPSYIRISDFLEEIYKDESYSLNAEVIKVSDVRRVLSNVKQYFIHCMVRIPILRKLILERIFHKDGEEMMQNYRYTKNMIKKNDSSKQEIESIKGRIRKLL